ncbi:hypothetical protein KJ966_03005 [bacterium]|nr:hypothetical protein [bacterium]
MFFIKKNSKKKPEPYKFLEGTNPKIDKVMVGLFGNLGKMIKSLATKKTREFVGKHLKEYLLQTAPGYEYAQPLLGSEDEEKLLLEYKKKRFLEVAKPCDVILVKGNLRISHIIQTLTKSPYSHAALYKGDGEIIEVEPEGVLINSINKYIHLDIRICRPVMLSNKGKKTVLDYMEKMIKLQPKYDIENMGNLLFKYWYTKFRPDTKVYIGGSTDFEKYYICSAMIAHGFHEAGYPVTPSLRFKKKNKKITSLKTITDFEKMVNLMKKNYSQIVPGDFDNSPFFASIKFLYLDSKQNAKRQLHLEEEEEISQKTET